MAQVKHTCSVTAGSSVVTIPSADVSARIKAGAIFLVDPLFIPYTVASDAVYTGGNTVVTLTGNYAGATNAAAAGVFAVDFTVPGGIPTVAQGDVGTAAVFTAAMYRIQAIMAAGITISPSSQVNADWNATSGAALILNKPDLTASVNSGSGSGSGISSSAQPFDLTAFCPGVPPANVLITRVPLARTVVFPCPLTGSVAIATSPATSQTDFQIRKNNVYFGTIRFAAGAMTATFPETIVCATVSFAAGDVISIVGPATADATLANIGIVLKGTR